MFKRILVALAADTPGHETLDESVIREASAIAAATQATVNLLHVLLPIGSGIPDPIYMTADGMHSTVNVDAFQTCIDDWKSLQQSSQAKLVAQAEAMAQRDINVEWTQATGDPGRKICEVAQTWQADLIIMGRRGRAGVSELLLGSVSNYVMHHAACAILTVQRGKAPQSASASQ